jgi:hypothetical protein
VDENVDENVGKNLWDDDETPGPVLLFRCLACRRGRITLFAPDDGRGRRVPCPVCHGWGRVAC